MMNDKKTDDHILIVDDTLKNIQVLGAILRKEGFQINVAQNGRQALDSVERVMPDLILLDIMMPVMDGFETCRRLKENPETAKIPIIFLTAKVDPDDIVKGLTLGAVDYVTKPFNATELLSRVDTHLTINRLRRELEARVKELASALADIQRMHREHSAFLRHELNNAISPIMGYADLLATRGKDSMDPKQLGWTKKILQGARAMQDLLNALKDLQEFERGKLAIDTSRTDIAEIIARTASELETSSGGNAKIEFLADGDGFWVDADAAILTGVFKNLIKNGIEHVEGLSTEDERTVRMRLWNEDGRVLFTINNKGEPVPPKRLETFFEKFNSTKTKEGGTGLGTSYARLVTEAHHGTISVTSNAEDGTTVTVGLPMADSSD